MQGIVVQQRYELRIIQRARISLKLGAIDEVASRRLQVHPTAQIGHPTVKTADIRGPRQRRLIKAIDFTRPVALNAARQYVVTGPARQGVGVSIA